MFLVSILLLLAVPSLGITVYGAKRWISLGFFNMQPSELAKVAVLILCAKELAGDGDLLSWSKLMHTSIIGIIPGVLIISQPDLGTGLTIMALVAGMILYHGLQGRVWKILMIAVPILVPLMAWGGWSLLLDYHKRRILTFLDPSIDPKGAGYHIMQSQIAIGSGRMWGKGFFEGTQSQLRFLPEKHTDFALAVFGEEWGFVGCVILLCLFCMFLLAMLNTVRDAKDRFGSTLVAGIFIYFFWQMLINMGMVIGLMPVVGIPLPFISYGGSSTMINFILIGLTLNVSMRRFIFTR
jgi:rod shape determining protein RodA